MHRFLYGLILLLVLASCAKDDDSNELGRLGSTNRLSTGDSARDFLTEDHFTAIVMEVVYVDNFPPSDAALDTFSGFINNHCHKSGGVEILKRAIPSPGKEAYTVAEVDSLERQLRSQYNTENRLAMFVFYLDGSYIQLDESSEKSNSSVVLGVAYRNTSFVVFKERINRLLSSQTNALESTVLRHEFSHLLGLVNVGTQMQTNHIDPEHGHHCNVEDCLMHYKVETGWQFSEGSTEYQLPELDNQCITDLRANGGK